MSMEEEGNKICNSKEDSFSALDAITMADTEIFASEEEEGLEEEEEEEEEEEDDDDDENIGDGECTLTFDAEMNPLDFMNDDALGVQPIQQFGRLEYEALAEKKRKALVNHQSESSRKKLRQEDQNVATFDEIMEVMNYGQRKSRKRKSKKRGRRKGSRNKLTPEVTQKLGDATLHYAHGRYSEAISLLNEVIRVAPHLSDPFHTLGLVYKELGEKKKAFNCYMFAAKLTPKDPSLWKLLVTWSLELGNNALAMHCLNRAITADPEDITLRFHCASLYMEAGEYKKASESYDQIIKLCPENAEAHKTAAKLHKVCGQAERSISILEDFLKDHADVADLSVVDLLASVCMENNEHYRALQYIEHAQSINYSGENLPMHLLIKAGICHVYLGRMENAETIFRVFELENTSDHVEFITEVAYAYMSVAHYQSALKYYLVLDENAGHDNANLHLKIAQCYALLKEKAQAIQFFYKALDKLPNNVEARLSLASLLLEEDKEDEVISLLSPPTNVESTLALSSDQSISLWWLDGKIKLMLSNIYQAKGMTKEFVDAIFPLIRDSLFIETINQKIKQKKRLPSSVLQERVKVLNNLQTDDVFQVRPIAKNSELSKAARAKKLLQKRATLKEEKRMAALAAGLDWKSDDSDDESPQQARREPLLPKFLKDEKHHQLILDLCKGLASLQRYWDALEIINLFLRVAQKILSAKTKEELRCIGAQIESNISTGCDYLRSIIHERPYSNAAWNWYYKATTGSVNQCSKHSKFLRGMRKKHKDSIPPIVISGHLHTMDSRHQAAAREYLYAYKLLPGSPLINLCVGTSLVNLALNFRLQNKHYCIAQGLGFLYNNLRLCRSNQEALYNIARAYHHVGFFSLAATYYEKVLSTHEKDYPIPKLSNEIANSTKNSTPGYCNLRREAAYNLHLIYKRSGAFDLARQVLKDHCTL